MNKNILLSTITAMLLAGCGSSEGFTVISEKGVDIIAPVIALNGNGSLTIEKGTTYTDQGASAIDDVDGAVGITTSGSVDTSKDGTYTITYSAVDSSGNKSTASRTVIVTTPIDPNAPVITLNGNATLTIENGTTYSDQGASAIDDVDGAVSVTTSGSVDTSKDGTYTITYSAVDSSGNKATDVTRTVTVTTSKTSLSGYIIDGAVSGANVFIDLNANSSHDTNEPSTATDANGYYEFNLSNSDFKYDVSIIATGGIDTVTNQSFTGTIKKRIQKGDNLKGLIATPSTTLVEALVSQHKMSIDDARAKVAKFLDIESDKVIANPLSDVSLYRLNLMLIKYAQLLDGDFVDLASQIATFEGTMMTLNNEETYKLDTIWKLAKDISKVPSIGEGNGALDVMLAPTHKSDQSIVEEIANGLNIVGSNSVLDNITTNLRLPIAHSYRNDTTIVWSGGGDKVNLSTGSITRPTFNEGDVTTTLKATIKKGKASTTKEFTIKLKATDITPQKALDNAATRVTFEQIKGNNSATNNITSNLALPASLPYGIVATYNNNSCSAIDTSGIVTQPAYNLIAQSCNFVITLTHSSGLTKEVSHALTVAPKAPTNQEAIDEAILETEAIPSPFDANTKLPKTSKYGVAITYTASNPRGFVNSNGSITQDTNETVVTFDYTLAKGDLSINKSREVVIKAKAKTPDDILALAKPLITWNAIKLKNTAENNVTSDLNLTKSLVVEGRNIGVAWNSNNLDTINATNGTVVPQDVNTTVNLYATLSLSGATNVMTDTFELVVIEKGIDPNQKAVEDARADLDFDDIKGENTDANSVTKDLNLITSLVGHEGVVISWVSNKDTIVVKDGVGLVNTDIKDSQLVTLSATLSKGATARTTQDINVTVFVPSL